MSKKQAAQVAFTRKAAKLKAESKIKPDRPQGVGTNVPTQNESPLPTPISASPQQPRAPPKRFHLDKRAAELAAAPGDDDELLTADDLARWLKVSIQLVNLMRHRGDGPEFERLAPRIIRYRRGKVRQWLDERSHACTAEYAR